MHHQRRNHFMKKRERKPRGTKGGKGVPWDTAGRARANNNNNNNNSNNSNSNNNYYYG